jgi:hypothetical protein
MESRPLPPLRSIALAAAIAVALACGPAAQDPSASAAVTALPLVAAADHHDVSPPLRDIQPAALRPTFREHGVGPLPLAQLFQQPDPVLQAQAGPLVAATAGLGFPGVGNGDYGFVPNAAPPDTNLAVGATQVVQWVN